MLRWAFMFFVISLVEGALGFTDAKLFFVLAISLFVIFQRAQRAHPIEDQATLLSK